MTRQLTILFGIPGSGLDEAVRAINCGDSAYSGAGVAVTTTALVEARAGVAISDLVIDRHALAPLFDAALRSAVTGAYRLVAATGDELTRQANQELVRTRATRLIELTCDLQTQARRLGFNAPHSVGLGPVRAQLRTQGRQRRAQWEGLANAIIDTSGWEMAQFNGLVDTILQGKI